MSSIVDAAGLPRGWKSLQPPKSMRLDHNPPLAQVYKVSKPEWYTFWRQPDYERTGEILDMYLGVDCVQAQQRQFNFEGNEFLSSTQTKLPAAEVTQLPCDVTRKPDTEIKTKHINALGLAIGRKILGKVIGASPKLTLEHFKSVSITGLIVEKINFDERHLPKERGAIDMRDYKALSFVRGVAHATGITITTKVKLEAELEVDLGIAKLTPSSSHAAENEHSYKLDEDFPVAVLFEHLVFDDGKFQLRKGAKAQGEEEDDTAAILGTLDFLENEVEVDGEPVPVVPFGDADAVFELLSALPDKVAISGAPDEAARAFMPGLFDASGAVIALSPGGGEPVPFAPLYSSTLRGELTILTLDEAALEAQNQQQQ